MADYRTEAEVYKWTLKHHSPDSKDILKGHIKQTQEKNWRSQMTKNDNFELKYGINNNDLVKKTNWSSSEDNRKFITLKNS